MDIQQQMDEMNERTKNIHSAYLPLAIARNLNDNAAVTAMALAGITKIAAGKSEDVKAELRTIYAAIRSQGGEAYAAHKARLIEIEEGGKTDWAAIRANLSPKAEKYDRSNPYDNGEIESMPARYRSK